MYKCAAFYQILHVEKHSKPSTSGSRNEIIPETSVLGCEGGRERWQGSLHDIEDRNVFIKFGYKNYSSYSLYSEDGDKIAISSNTFKPSLELFLQCFISMGHLFVITVDTNLNHTI